MPKLTSYAVGRKCDCLLALGAALGCPWKAKKFMNDFLADVPEREVAFVKKLPPEITQAITDLERDQWMEVTHIVAMTRPERDGYIIRSVFFSRVSQLYEKHFRAKVEEAA